VPQTIGYVALLVRDYDEAISFFTRALSFAVIEILFLATASATKSAAYSSVLRDLTEPICCWRKPPRPKNSAALAIKPEAASFSSCTPMTFGAITRRCRRKA
jgi:catechol 2,3-dioxygenase-like lactoylglutathione lyase family enzyme